MHASNGFKRRTKPTRDGHKRIKMNQNAVGIAAKKRLRHDLEPNEEDGQGKEKADGVSYRTERLNELPGDDEKGGEIGNVIGDGDSSEKGLSIFNQPKQLWRSFATCIGGMTHPDATDG